MAPASNSSPQIRVFADPEQTAKAAADLVASALSKRPNLLLCASAGGTPTLMYRHLAVLRASRPRLFARMRVLQIDEWAGLHTDCPATCAADLREKLIRPLGLPEKHFLSFRTAAEDPGRECERISRWLATNGPIDICILGLGLNGHIAMNEPGDWLTPGVHWAKLAAGSRNHAMLQEVKKKPRFGFTLGMADILQARHILLLVTGQHKRRVLRRFLKRQVSTSLPVSFLWLHGNATVMCDKDAAGNM